MKVADTDAEKAGLCNASFGSYSARQKPSQRDNHHCCAFIAPLLPKERTTPVKSFVFNIKGEMYRPSKEYDMEMETVHKGLVMPKASVASDLFMKAFFFFFFKIAVL